jgi:hypothetical protein
VVVVVDTKMLLQSPSMIKGLGKAKKLAPVRCMHGARVRGEDGTLAISFSDLLNRTQQSRIWLTNFKNMFLGARYRRRRAAASCST